MIKLLTTCSAQDLSKCEKLEASLNLYKWDYHIIPHQWKGFGDKILETYKYLKANPDVTHFFYTDAWDTIVCWGMSETINVVKQNNWMNKIVLSAEKGCYPHPEKAVLYPETSSEWKYVNGGGWFCNSELFCEMVERYPLTSETVDQVWFTDLFLKEPDLVELDYRCEIFQTIAFCTDETFIITRGLSVFNTVTHSLPTFIHGNGHTPMDRFYKLI